MTMDDFRDRAACVGTDPEIFFPVGAPGAPVYERELAKAKAVCRRCPVMIDCYFYALDQGIEYGVYGGADEFERAKLSRELPRTRVA